VIVGLFVRFGKLVGRVSSGGNNSRVPALHPPPELRQLQVKGNDYLQSLLSFELKLPSFLAVLHNEARRPSNVTIITRQFGITDYDILQWNQIV